jgi:hypothetical protein
LSEYEWSAEQEYNKKKIQENSLAKVIVGLLCKEPLNFEYDNSHHKRTKNTCNFYVNFLILEMEFFQKAINDGTSS